jgi:hypothetical protein
VARRPQGHSNALTGGMSLQPACRSRRAGGVRHCGGRNCARQVQNARLRSWGVKFAAIRLLVSLLIVIVTSELLGRYLIRWGYTIAEGAAG